MGNFILLFIGYALMGVGTMYIADNFETKQSVSILVFGWGIAIYLGAVLDYWSKRIRNLESR